MGLTIGLALGAFASTTLCVYMKAYVYLILIAISLVCYVCLLFKHHNLKKTSIKTQNAESLVKNGNIKLLQIQSIENKK
jgi:hypothetical protein